MYDDLFMEVVADLLHVSCFTILMTVIRIIMKCQNEE